MSREIVCYYRTKDRNREDDPFKLDPIKANGCSINATTFQLCLDLELSSVGVGCNFMRTSPSPHSGKPHGRKMLVTSCSGGDVKRDFVDRSEDQSDGMHFRADRPWWD